MISAFETMWVLVLFDLPVSSKEERKKATSFRNYLLDEGFIMKQFSVYLKPVRNRVAADMLGDRIQKFVPPEGEVSVMFFTDKQYSLTRNFSGNLSKPTEKQPQQLVLI